MDLVKLLGVLGRSWPYKDELEDPTDLTLVFDTVLLWGFETPFDKVCVLVNPLVPVPVPARFGFEGIVGLPGDFDDGDLLALTDL